MSDSMRRARRWPALSPSPFSSRTYESISDDGERVDGTAQTPIDLERRRHEQEGSLTGVGQAGGQLRQIEQLEHVDAVVAQKRLVDVEGIAPGWGREWLQSAVVHTDQHRITLRQPIGRLVGQPGLAAVECRVTVLEQVEPSGADDHGIARAQRDAVAIERSLQVMHLDELTDLPGSASGLGDVQED